MCLCCPVCCRNELLGLEGMVTQKNPDENVNHLPSAAPQCVVDGTALASGDNSDVNKRCTWHSFLYFPCFACQMLYMFLLNVACAQNWIYCTDSRKL